MKPKVEKKVPEKKPNILSLMFQEDAFVDFYMRGKTKAFPCHRVVVASELFRLQSSGLTSQIVIKNQ